MKIYFACAMHGSFSNTGFSTLKELRTALQQAGFTLVTTHQTEDNIKEIEEPLGSEHIYKRDRKWIEECDIVVAEISNPSLGVGAEITDAIYLNKPVIGLYATEGKNISMYTRGQLKANKNCTETKYTDTEDFIKKVKEFSENITA